jgi:hypothetical protein
LGQSIFPESARETGRRIWLYPEEIKILKYTSTSDGAGDVNAAWDDPDDADAVDGRIDPVGRTGEESEHGGQIAEGSTHRVRFRTPQDVNPNDRLFVKEETWLVTGIEYTTDELVTTAQVRLL